MSHDSDCSTNNAGSPSLIGPCDCSNLADLSPRLRGIIETFEHKSIRLSHTPKDSSRRVKAQSEYLKARAALAQAMRKLSAPAPATDEQVKRVCLNAECSRYQHEAGQVCGTGCAVCGSKLGIKS